jgi:hypothetical protein
MIYERKVKGIVHRAYDTEIEFKKDHPHTAIVSNWRKAEEGQWCRSDDNKIVQVLRKDSMSNDKVFYIRTIIGMVRLGSNVKLFGTTKDNIYRFTKKSSYQDYKDYLLTN